MARNNSANTAVAANALAVMAVSSTENPKWQVGEADAKLASTVDLNSLTTKSAQMRALQAAGLKTGPISRILSAHYNKEVKYQHVRNVLNQPAPAIKTEEVIAPTE